MGPIFFSFFLEICIFFFQKTVRITLEILAPTVTYFKKNTFGAITVYVVVDPDPKQLQYSSYLAFLR